MLRSLSQLRLFQMRLKGLAAFAAGLFSFFAFFEVDMSKLIGEAEKVSFFFGRGKNLT